MFSPSAAASAVRGRAAAWCVLPLAVLALASCGDDDETERIPASGERETTTTAEATSTTTAAATEPVGEWTIESLASGGDTTQAPDDASLAFAEGSVNLATGCNRGTGPAEVGDGTMVLGPLGLTLMACEPEVMTWEAELVAFLEGELTYELSGDDLVLTHDDTELTLSPLA